MSYEAFSEGTHRLIAVAVAVCVIVVVGVGASLIALGIRTEGEVKSACVDAGGVWSGSTCAWSKGDPVVVEEDGSIAGYGCLVGYPCDEGER